MIVQIKETYGYLKNYKQTSIDFFKENGEWKETDGYISEERKAAGEVADKRVEYLFIGHIDQIPVDILNSEKSNISYFKGIKSMVEQAIHSDMGIMKTLNANAINVHLPSMDLLMINETLLLEDSCTDSLQKNLDDGWGIIACIPRPGQRRPDYILGRVKK